MAMTRNTPEAPGVGDEAQQRQRQEDVVRDALRAAQGHQVGALDLGAHPADGVRGQPRGHAPVAKHSRARNTKSGRKAMPQTIHE